MVNVLVVDLYSDNILLNIINGDIIIYKKLY